jgi:hypothetical protein
MSSEKKPYQSPKIYQVELNQEQAILTTCSVGVTNVSTSANRGCIAGTCKRGGNAGRDSASHPS